MEKLTPEKLDERRSTVVKNEHNWIKVGMSTCGIAAGADEVYKTLIEENDRRNLGLAISKCGCAGQCYAEPLVEVSVEGLPCVVYGRINQETAREIIERHVLAKQLLNDHIFNVKVK